MTPPSSTRTRWCSGQKAVARLARSVRRSKGERSPSLSGCPEDGEPGAIVETGDRTISHKVFVGNLSYETTPDQLASFMSEVGQVLDVYLPADRNTGRPRGFALVEFSDADEAAQAIERFDGADLDGRNIRVNAAEDRPRSSAPPPFARGGPPGGRGKHAGGGKNKSSRRRIRSRKRSL